MKRLILAFGLLIGLFALPSEAQQVCFGSSCGGGAGSGAASGSPITGCTAYSIVSIDSAGNLACTPNPVVNGSVSTAGRSILTIRDTITGASATSNFLNVTGTAPATLSAETNMFSLSYTLDNDSQAQYAISASASGGAGSSALSAAVHGVNSATNTYAFGLYGEATGAAIDSVGVYGYSGAGTNRFGVIGSLAGGALTGNSAMAADNGAVAANIFEARDNGTPVFTIADGGAGIFGSAAGAANSIAVQETAGCITFEGSSADTDEGLLCVVNPTGGGDSQWNLPNYGGAASRTIAVAEWTANPWASQTMSTANTWSFAGIGSIGANAAQTPATPFVGTSTTSNSWNFLEIADTNFDFNNGRCLTAACTNPSLIIHSPDQVTTEYLQLSADATGAGKVQSNFGEVTVGAFKTNITEGAAQAIVRITMPSAGMFGATVTYTVSDSDGTDHIARGGNIVIQGVNKAGTSVCTIAAARDTEAEDGSEVAQTAALTLTYTWTNVVNTTSCDLSLNAASNAGVNTLDIQYTVVLTGTSNAISVNPQ